MSSSDFRDDDRNRESVVARDDLHAVTFGSDCEIAQRPLMGPKFAKMMVSQRLGGLGQSPALRAVFDLHQLRRTYALVLHGSSAEPSGMAVMRGHSR